MSSVNWAGDYTIKGNVRETVVSNVSQFDFEAIYIFRTLSEVYMATAGINIQQLQPISNSVATCAKIHFSAITSTGSQLLG